MAHPIFFPGGSGTCKRGGIFQKSAGKIGGYQTLANFGDEASASDFFDE